MKPNYFSHFLSYILLTMFSLPLQAAVSNDWLTLDAGEETDDFFIDTDLVATPTDDPLLEYWASQKEKEGNSNTTSATGMEKNLKDINISATIKNKDFLFIGDRTDNGISVFIKARNGRLTHVLNTKKRKFDGITLNAIQALKIVSISDAWFLFAKPKGHEVQIVLNVGYDGTLNYITTLAASFNPEEEAEPKSNKQSSMQNINEGKITTSDSQKQKVMEENQQVDSPLSKLFISSIHVGGKKFFIVKSNHSYLQNLQKNISAFEAQTISALHPKIFIIDSKGVLLQQEHSTSTGVPKNLFGLDDIKIDIYAIADRHYVLVKKKLRIIVDTPMPGNSIAQESENSNFSEADDTSKIQLSDRQILDVFRISNNGKLSYLVSKANQTNYSSEFASKETDITVQLEEWESFANEILLSDDSFGIDIEEKNASDEDKSVATQENTTLPEANIPAAGKTIGKIKYEASPQQNRLAINSILVDDELYLFLLKEKHTTETKGVLNASDQQYLLHIAKLSN